MLSQSLYCSLMPVSVCSYWSLQGGESLSVQRQQLEELYLAHSGSMSILLEEDDGLQNHNHGLPQGPANFTLLWYTINNSSQR